MELPIIVLQEVTGYGYVDVRNVVTNGIVYANVTNSDAVDQLYAHVQIRS